MKFSLTISDATQEEIEKFLATSSWHRASSNIVGHTVADGSMTTIVNHSDDDGPTNTMAPMADAAGIAMG